MAQALVLGSTGHIGAHVTRALLAQGHTVRAGFRNPKYLSVLEGLKVEKAQLDLADASSLKAALTGCDWVFHVAGHYPVRGRQRSDAVEEGTGLIQTFLSAVEATRPSRVVFTSSAAVIRQVPDREANEKDAEPWPLTQWRSLYATVKIALEQEVLKAAAGGLPVVVVNPSLCLGEYDMHAFSGRAALVFAKRRIPFYTEGAFNVVYTGNVGVGHLRAAERGRVGERYLLTGHNVTMKQFATSVAQAAGLPPPRWRLPVPVMAASATVMEAWAGLTRTEPMYTREETRRVRRGYRLDGAKAREELGLPETPLEETIQRAVDWFKRNGYC